MPDVRTTRDLILERYHTLVSSRIPRDPAHLRRSWARALDACLPASRDTAILDAGCGDGMLLDFLRDRGFTRLAGIDLSPENVAHCRAKGLSGVVCGDVLDADALPCAPGGWDCILCLDLLEHLPVERLGGLLIALRERLSRNGTLIVQTVNMAYLGANWVRYGDLTHTTGFTEISLWTLLRAAGFEAVEIRPHWPATTWRGRAREAALCLLHRAFYLIEGTFAPRIPSKNLLALARP